LHGFLQDGIGQTARHLPGSEGGIGGHQHRKQSVPRKCDSGVQASAGARGDQYKLHGAPQKRPQFAPCRALGFENEEAVLESRHGREHARRSTQFPQRRQRSPIVANQNRRAMLPFKRCGGQLRHGSGYLSRPGRNQYQMAGVEGVHRRHGTSSGTVT
jgi:hypothetical protein